MNTHMNEAVMFPIHTPQQPKEMKSHKKLKHTHQRSDLLDGLPDDILISILCKLSSTARCPSDFINVLIACKRLNRLGLHPIVLSKAGPQTLGFRPKNWSEKAHRFLKLCVNAGSVEALYTLGMIRFYCLNNRRGGASLMARAAMKSHAPALYSLAVIQFNGSGGLKDAKDLRAGVALCARAAFLGHVDALRELGHCLQDGYGVRKNIGEGRRLLVEANAREVACVLRSVKWGEQGNVDMGPDLWSDYGFSVAVREVHPVNRFLVEWFGLHGEGVRMCSHVRCGRPELRRNEFRRCSGCGKVNYCSRGCQAHDWKMSHKVECAPIQQWLMDQEPLQIHDDDDRMVEIQPRED